MGNKIDKKYDIDALGNLNIIQFLPYFPPHKGGLETHALEWGKWWKKKGYGNVYNIITDFEQDHILLERIIFEGKNIGYKNDDIYNLIVPSIEIISNFPIYKIWGKEYRLIIKYLKEKKIDIVITRTRFFLTSLIGGIFARKNKLKWYHIEHGSDYVKLNNRFKTFVARLYDKLIGKWIFKKADKIIPISEAVKNFVIKLGGKKINFGKVIYRGLDLPKNMKIQENLKDKFNDKIIIGYVGRLYKWKNVESLIKAFYNLNKNLQNKIQLVIVGDGEDYKILKNLDRENKIYFTGGQSFKKALCYQKEFDIHIHPSSPGGGLATTLLQAMNLGCFIVSTPYEGADEVIVDGKNGILLVDDSIAELKRGLIEGVNMIGKKKEFALFNRKLFNDSFIWDKNIKDYYNLFI